MLNPQEIRKEFPILTQTVYGKPLIYLDNAATTQKPQCVIDAISNAYCTINANVHRGVHHLSQVATEEFEQARRTVQQFIGAAHSHEIIFTRGTTESINLVASSFGNTFLKEGDEVIISTMEHHSNIVPWQLLRDKKGIVLKVIPIDDCGHLKLEALEALLTPRTRLVSVAHVSNVLATVNPVKRIAEMVHAHGALLLVDGAQSVPHIKVDVQELDCDFYVFSGHKVYGPTGVGVLYGKESLLDRMPPYQGGGEMIARVTFEKTTYERLPYKFEAGTPDYVGTHALAVALQYVSHIGMEAIAAHEHALTQLAMEQMRGIKGMQLYGETEDKGAVVAFNIEGIHHLDLGTLLDRLGIAIRTGHHCAQPLMQHYGVEGMARASFALYNTKAEVEALVAGIERVRRMF